MCRVGNAVRRRADAVRTMRRAGTAVRRRAAPCCAVRRRVRRVCRVATRRAVWQGRAVWRAVWHAVRRFFSRADFEQNRAKMLCFLVIFVKMLNL